MDPCYNITCSTACSGPVPGLNQVDIKCGWDVRQNRCATGYPPETDQFLESEPRACSRFTESPTHHRIGVDPGHGPEGTTGASSDTGVSLIAGSTAGVVMIIIAGAVLLWRWQKHGGGGGGATAPDPAFGGESESGTWDFFISHTQRNGLATTIASELHTDLLAAGATCWFDVKMADKSEAAMRHGVENSRAVIAVITGPCHNPDRPDDDVTDNAYFKRD